MDSTHTRIRVDDLNALERMREERGMGSIPEMIHYLIYIDITRNNPFDALELENRKLRLELEEIKKRK